MALVVKNPRDVAFAYAADRVINSFYSGSGSTVIFIVVNRDALQHTTEAWSVTF